MGRQPELSEPAARRDEHAARRLEPLGKAALIASVEADAALGTPLDRTA
jgi:hypothetical protein